jgi:hypothetical protein
MPRKTKIETETKTKTKLLIAVCKQACSMRASFRVASYPTGQIRQINKNPSSNNKTKHQYPLIIKSSKQKTIEKVSAH